MSVSLAPELLRRPVKVLVVGCGGNGSAVAAGLPYLHQAMLVHGHPGGLDVTVMDGDTVSPTNCVRQPFSQAEIGHSKAVVLVSRMNLFWGLDWHAVPEHFCPRTSLDRIDVLVGCVDTWNRNGSRSTKLTRSMVRPASPAVSAFSVRQTTWWPRLDAKPTTMCTGR